MNVSVIIPVLNSPEVVRRHILYWGGMTLPKDVEFIIMDDGSDPPLSSDEFGLPDLVRQLGLNLRIYETGEKRQWTSSIARNRAAEIAKGRNLVMVDVDYIVSQKLIMDVHGFTGQRMQFIREFGVLDENGHFTQDKEVLFNYGLLPSRYARRGVKLSPHPNSYAMNRDVFLDIGGYNEDLVLRRRYPQGEDNGFKTAWVRWARAHNCWSDPHRPIVYMFPCGQYCGDVDYNPHGLFHTLSRKTQRNVFWHRQLRREQRHEQSQ